MFVVGGFVGGGCKRDRLCGRWLAIGGSGAFLGLIENSKHASSSTWCGRLCEKTAAPWRFFFGCHGFGLAKTA